MLQRFAPPIQAPIAAAFGSMTSNATVKSTDNIANTFPVVKASSGADQDTGSASTSVQKCNTEEQQRGRKKEEQQSEKKHAVGVGWAENVASMNAENT